MSAALALAVDIGGSKFITALIRKSGEILASEKRLWPAAKIPGADDLVSGICSAVRSMLDANPRYKPDVMGATIPGLADPQKGMWVEASFSGIRNLPFVSIMKKAFHLPVYIDNDVRSCALAERRWGCCAGPEPVDDFLWITVSNGIGGCVFAGGKPYRGAGGNAGEIGHIIVEEGKDARQCGAGHAGCAEMHASGRGLALNYLQLGGNETIHGEAASAKNIAVLARGGDKTAIAAYELEGRYLARAIGAAVNLLCPAKVVIGGGVSLDFDLFWPSLEKNLKARIYENANPDLRVEPSPLGYNAGLLGAAALGFRAR